MSLYTYGNGLTGSKGEEGTRLYHFNHLGNTTAITAMDGAVQETFTYGTYGELTSGDPQATPFLYNGQFGIMTDDNGLYYMRARYYNVEVKRFVNRDTLRGDIGNGQSLNRYSYVEGNPVMNVDPSGHTAITVNDTLFMNTDADSMVMAGTEMSISDFAKEPGNAALKRPSLLKKNKGVLYKYDKRWRPALEGGGVDAYDGGCRDKKYGKYKKQSGPGARFNTPDEAAEDFARIFNKHSIEQGREFGTFIYERKAYVGSRFGIKRYHFHYSYVYPNRGGKGHVTPPTNWFGKKKVVAYAHTHGKHMEGYEELHEKYSGKDYSLAKKNGKPSYLATPMGKLKKYDPRTGKEEELLDDLPYDPSHPWKKK